MIRTPEEVAVLTAVMFKRSTHKRARLSLQTIRRVSGRNHIRGAFIQMLTQHLEDLGLNMHELDRGGYGLIPSSALDGAPAITVKRLLSDDLKRLKQGKIDIDDFRSELDEESAPDDEDTE